MREESTKLKTYRVSVGHSEVVVQAATPAEAIASARRQLALELPRFYDIISTLDIRRFKVLHAA